MSRIKSAYQDEIETIETPAEPQGYEGSTEEEEPEHGFEDYEGF